LHDLPETIRQLDRCHRRQGCPGGGLGAGDQRVDIVLIDDVLVLGRRHTATGREIGCPHVRYPAQRITGSAGCCSRRIGHRCRGAPQVQAGERGLAQRIRNRHLLDWPAVGWGIRGAGGASGRVRRVHEYCGRGHPAGSIPGLHGAVPPQRAAGRGHRVLGPGFVARPVQHSQRFTIVVMAGRGRDHRGVQRGAAAGAGLVRFRLRGHPPCDIVRVVGVGTHGADIRQATGRFLLRHGAPPVVEAGTARRFHRPGHRLGDHSAARGRDDVRGQIRHTVAALRGGRLQHLRGAHLGSQ